MIINPPPPPSRISLPLSPSHSHTLSLAHSLFIFSLYLCLFKGLRVIPVLSFISYITVPWPSIDCGYIYIYRILLWYINNKPNAREQMTMLGLFIQMFAPIVSDFARLLTLIIPLKTGIMFFWFFF